MNSTPFTRRLTQLACALAALLCLQVSAQAQVFSGTFPIDGSQEVPSNGSAGTGTGMVTLDTSTNTLSWNIVFSGLGTPQTAAHFHGPAAPGSNAGVQVNIGTGSPNIGSTVVSASQAADIVAGLWYVNIHSSGFPGGEIRGQLVVGPVAAIPTMGEWGLIAMTLLLLGTSVVFLRRRKLVAAS